MLYDGRRDKYPKLFAFIAWLRTQPADGTYNWNDATKCACAQFFGHRSDMSWAENDINFNEMARGPWWTSAGYRICDNWTFGKLLERAEAKLESLTP